MCTGCVYVVWFCEVTSLPRLCKAEVSKEEFLKDFFKTFKVSKRFQSTKRSRTSQVSHCFLSRDKAMFQCPRVPQSAPTVAVPGPGPTRSPSHVVTSCRSRLKSRASAMHWPASTARHVHRNDVVSRTPQISVHDVHDVHITRPTNLCQVP